jgi:hypothetical protein
LGKLSQLTFALPAPLVKFVGQEVPREMRLNASRGTLPLPPKDLVTAVYFLTLDPDDEIRNSARETLLKMPSALLKPVLADPKAHPLILDFFARNLPQDSELQETIALNKATDDETIAFQATLTNKKLVDIISNNQIRLLRSTKIVDALSENPLTSPAMLDRIIKFLEVEAKIYKKIEKKPPAGEGIEVEIEQLPEEEEVAPVTEQEVAPVTVEGEFVENAWANLTYSQELLSDKEFKTNEEKDAEEANLSKKISNMKISEKIKLALVGNLSARSILIRDSNKLVATAVLKSPRITEAEVEAVSRSHSVSEEVIRLIANNKEWAKNYNIKVNLVNNSKTPIHESLKFLNHLRDKDLAGVAKSKNVPQPVVVAARKLLQTRQEGAQKKKHH